MDDDDVLYASGLELFFQQINEQIKKNSDYQLDDLEKEIIKWANDCGFSPRKFLEYYKNYEQNKDDSKPTSDI
mgnify:CR=1 FL=1